jgi:endonuclease/exonuclease/phosphatase family metal-dependent hydrolase
VRIEAAEIVLTEPVVPSRSGPVTISDHFGLLATLRWEASE